MARFKMDDGAIIDTKKALQSWEECTDWNGNNHISRATGSQWNHETLYKSAKGNYYIVSSSQIQGNMDYARWVTPQDAARWLLLMEEDLPEDLEQYGEEVSE